MPFRAGWKKKMISWIRLSIDTLTQASELWEQRVHSHRDPLSGVIKNICRQGGPRAGGTRSRAEQVFGDCHNKSLNKQQQPAHNTTSDVDTQRQYSYNGGTQPRHRPRPRRRRRHRIRLVSVLVGGSGGRAPAVLRSCCILHVERNFRSNLTAPKRKYKRISF